MFCCAPSRALDDDALSARSILSSTKAAAGLLQVKAASSAGLEGGCGLLMLLSKAPMVGLALDGDAMLPSVWPSPSLDSAGDIAGLAFS